MRLWRLSKSKYVEAAFEGAGARKRGGRWNKAGRRVVYLSEHQSLAALEVLTRLSRELVPEYVSIALEVPDDLPVFKPSTDDLPRDWRQLEAPPSTQAFGDEWLSRASEALMRVPSVIIPDEYNYLLNPVHPDAKRIKHLAPAPFSFDPRLFKG